MPYFLGAVFWLVSLACFVPSLKGSFAFDAQFITGIIFALLPLFFWNRYVYGSVGVVILCVLGASSIYFGVRDCTLVDTIAFIVGVTIFVAYFKLGERWFPKKPDNISVLIATFVVSFATALLENSSLSFVLLGSFFSLWAADWRSASLRTELPLPKLFPILKRDFRPRKYSSRRMC